MKRKTMPSAAEKSFSFLVVDDSAFARRYIEKILLDMGGKAAGFAANGREAIDQYTKLHPDIVLMDITMPEMEGIEAVENIVAEDEAAKIVMVSSMGYQDMIKRALASGAKHFLTKPVRPNQVASVVRFVLGGN
jgi:two-component system chemotaxis response regulator CheY